MSTKQAQALPVLSYHTGAGWATLGFAKSPEGARAVVMRNLSDASLNLVKRHGFSVNVGRRTALQLELNGGPDGFIYDIGKVVPTGKVARS
ncbi:hypothetical protein AB4Y45_32255 [Paraburkholderia sp. EG287A]|uniref:hypothetical protein n=1 Tax=Paraburkholderia sp. EG287A TaxID=3237012 RepID=UPI0034D237EC